MLFQFSHATTVSIITRRVENLSDRIVTNSRPPSRQYATVEAYFHSPKILGRLQSQTISASDRGHCDRKKTYAIDVEAYQ